MISWKGLPVWFVFWEGLSVLSLFEWWVFGVFDSSGTDLTFFLIETASSSECKLLSRVIEASEMSL